MTLGGQAWHSGWQTYGTGRMIFKVGRHKSSLRLILLEHASAHRPDEVWKLEHPAAGWLHTQSTHVPPLPPASVPASQIPDLGETIINGRMDVSIELLAGGPCSSLTSFLAEPVSLLVACLPAIAVPSCLHLD